MEYRVMMVEVMLQGRTMFGLAVLSDHIDTLQWWALLCSGSGDRKRMSQDIGNAFVLMLLHVKSSVGDHGGGDRGQVTGRGGARLRRLEGLGFEAHCSLSRGRRSGV